MLPQHFYPTDLVIDQNWGLANLAIAAAGLAFVVAIVLLTGPARRRSKSTGVVTYKSTPVLSDWEKRAIQTLMDQLSPDRHLCPQVRLADIVNVQSVDRAAWRSAFNRIASKSVDFVVMDLRNGIPIMVIELDDRSHSRPERRDRDTLVNDVLRQASIPLVRFKPSGRLDIRPHLSAVT